MKNNDAFPHMIDGLFGELTQASYIIIDYKGFPCSKDDANITDFAIISVNGYRKSAEFHHNVKYICRRLRNDAMKLTNDLFPEEKAVFLEEVVKELKSFLKVVYIDKFFANTWNRASVKPFELCVFAQPMFTGDKYHDDPYYRDIFIARKAWKFSTNWKTVINDTIKTLSTAATVIEFMPVSPLMATVTQHISKIPVKLTLSRLACFARIFYENQMIGINNKSEYCRKFTEFFSTTIRDDLSYKNFKNHFDCPERDDLLFCLAETEQFMVIIKKLLKRAD